MVIRNEVPNTVIKRKMTLVSFLTFKDGFTNT